MGASYVTFEEHTFRVNDGVLGAALVAVFDQADLVSAEADGRLSPDLRSLLADWRQQVEADATGVLGREISGVSEGDLGDLATLVRSAQNELAKGNADRQLLLDERLHLVDHPRYGPRAFQIIAVLVALERLIERDWPPFDDDNPSLGIGYDDEMSHRFADTVLRVI